jgi:hypothetical protein
VTGKGFPDVNERETMMDNTILADELRFLREARYRHISAGIRDLDTCPGNFPPRFDLVFLQDPSDWDIGAHQVIPEGWRKS